MRSILASVLLLAPLTAVEGGGQLQDPAVPPEQAALEPSIRLLAAAARSEDSRRFLACWDLEHALDQVLELTPYEDGFLEGGSPERAALLQGVEGQLSAVRSHFAWETIEVLRIDAEPDGRHALALLRVRDAAGRRLRARLWLARRGVRWRAWDFGDPSGVRVTRLLAAVLAGLDSNRTGTQPGLPRWNVALGHLADGLKALRSADAAGIRSALRATEGVAFPPELEALRLYLRGSHAVAEERYEETLAWIAAAPQLDLAALDLLAAMAHNGLGQHEQALACARRFLERVGDDAKGRREEGLALVALGRRSEALAAFRAGLDEDPRDLELLVELACVLPSRRMGELGRRFVASGDPAASFEPLATELFGRGEDAALEVLIAAQRRVVPSDPWPEWYAAQLLAYNEGRYAEAAALVLAALPRVDDPEERAVFQGEYVSRMADAGRPLEGYERLDGAERAFEVLSERLEYDESTAELLELARRHAERFPDHPGVALLRARALVRLGRREEAEQAFAEAMQRVAEGELESVRQQRLRNLVEAGAWRRAYAEVPPRLGTFAQLAWLLWERGDIDALDQLVDLQRESGPDTGGTALVRWSLEVPWCRGQYEATLEQLRAHEAVLCGSEDVSDLYYWEDRYVRCCLRLGRLDDATQRALAIDERDDDPFYTALVHAAAGRQEQAAAALRRALDKEWLAEELYDDADLGPLLRAEGADALRGVVPPPEEDPGG